MDWHSLWESAKSNLGGAGHPACSIDEIVVPPARVRSIMKFRPLHDRVLVRRLEAAEKTAGGIIIPDTAQEKPQEGEVVAIGTGTRAEDGTVIALDLKAGDKILFGKWSGSEVKLDGEDLLIMKESDVLGIVG
jgi:chaperonin GroES